MGLRLGMVGGKVKSAKTLGKVTNPNPMIAINEGQDQTFTVWLLRETREATIAERTQQGYCPIFMLMHLNTLVRAGLSR